MRSPRFALPFVVLVPTLLLPTAPAGAVEYSAQRLIAPYFEVEVGNPYGLTSLVAIRNDGAETSNVVVTIRGGRPEGLLTAFGYTLIPNEVRTLNLRDVVPRSAAGEDGVVRGWVVIQSPEPASLSGDFFLVAPDQDYATGFELLDADAAYCRRWSSRFLGGAAFTGGTTFHVFTPFPGGADSPDPTIIFTSYDESGGFLATARLGSDYRSFSVPASSVVPPSSTFGSVNIEFLEGTDGIVLAEHTAFDRYAVGVTANCLDPGSMGGASRASWLEPRVTTVGYRGQVPAYAVEDGDPNGLTTLVAVRNETGSDLEVSMVAGGGGVVSLNRDYGLDAHEVKTVNLRDVLAGTVDPDGYRRGGLAVDVPDRFGSEDLFPESWSGDFFHVDPGENYATGGNLGGNRHAESFDCPVVTTRFLNGGGFTGGTVVSAYVGRANGDDPEDEPTVVGTVYDEPGAEVGTFELKMPSGSHSLRFDAEDVVPAGVAFGSLRLEFQRTRASVFTEHRASGRFSVGVPGTCAPSP